MKRSDYIYQSNFTILSIILDLMSRLLRNTILIPDRFHIVIQTRDALDKIRINLCYKSNHHYKKNKKYNKHFKKNMTQKDIVTNLINTNESLLDTYNLYQGIIKSIDKRD